MIYSTDSSTVGEYSKSSGRKVLLAAIGHPRCCGISLGEAELAEPLMRTYQEAVPRVRVGQLRFRTL